MQLSVSTNNLGCIPHVLLPFSVPRISAYMKPYPFAGRGVLFNPDLPDGEMHMYGDFPLALFEEI